VDLITRNVTVRGETSKKEKTRHVPLNAEARTVLQAWKPRRAAETI
jgi:site-specific recombinase XerC